MRRLTQGEVRQRADLVLEIFRGLKSLKRARVSALHPIYSPGLRGVSHYEAKFSSPANVDCGYALVSATDLDFPVAEVVEKGPTRFEVLRNRTGTRKFRAVRLGPEYLAAEGPGREFLTGIGHPPHAHANGKPAIERDESRSRGSAARRRGYLEPSEPRPIDRGYEVPRRSGRLSYRAVRKRYSVSLSPSDRVRTAWKEFDGLTSIPAQANVRWADGIANRPFIKQIPPETGANQFSSWSGCGATVWLNLIAWHDQWSSEILEGQPRFNNAHIDHLQMILSRNRNPDYLETGPPPLIGAFINEGYTSPDKMIRGFRFCKAHLGHDNSHWARWDPWNTDEDWVMDVAHDVIGNRRPFIVGYYQDWHSLLSG